jgi:hypothetical protein
MAIPVRAKVATIGTVMQAIRSCLSTVVATFSFLRIAHGGPRFDDERMVESGAENFERRLIYP